MNWRQLWRTHPDLSPARRVKRSSGVWSLTPRSTTSPRVTGRNIRAPYLRRLKSSFSSETVVARLTMVTLPYRHWMLKSSTANDKKRRTSGKTSLTGATGSPTLEPTGPYCANCLGKGHNLRPMYLLTLGVKPSPVQSQLQKLSRDNSPTLSLIAKTRR